MSFDNPLISVIIPTYNHSQFLEEAIQSVLAQEYQNLEIIVIDDGSTDGTREILSKYQGKVICIFQSNKGPSAARNRGIKVARGQYVAFLDSDDVWMPNKLFSQLRGIEEDKSVGVVGCSAFIIDHSGNILKHWVVKKNQSHDQFLRELTIRNEFYGGTSGALIRRGCFDRVGLFNENLRFGEDWDMWLRISKRYNIKFENECLVKLRKHNLSKDYNNLLLMERDISKIIETNINNGIIAGRKAYSYLYTGLGSYCLEKSEKWKAMLFAVRAIISYPIILFPDDIKYKVLLRVLFPKRV
jgi:glycosyltransferase involved in cell wall biosynthesis